MIRILSKNAGLWVAFVLFVALAAMSAQAQSINLNTPNEGTSVTVTGFGSYPQGPVEIFVNGASAGTTYAAVDGTFALSGVALNEGDVLQAYQQHTWNFNTDGDAEGWTAADGSINVSGGNLDFTINNVGGTPDLTVAFPTAHAAENIKVLEIRLTNGGGGSGPAMFMWNGSGFVGGQQVFMPASMAAPQTIVFVMTDNLVGHTAGQFLANAILRFNTGGYANGDTISIDYIRMREYADWHFDNDGDAMEWSGFSGLSGAGIAVTGGNLVYDNATAGTNAFIAYKFMNINTSVFTTLETRVDRDTGQAGQLEYFQWLDGAGYSDADSAQWFFTDGAGFQTIVTDLTANDWGIPSGPATLNNFGGTYSSHYPPTANETTTIDYIRLRPAAYYGPSGTVSAAKVVTDPATVSKDTLDDADFDTIAAAINWANATSGANTINILDSSLYSEDIPSVTESLTIAAATGETPVLEKNGFGTTGVKQAIQFALATDTTGTLTIQGASDNAKLTVRQASDSKPIINMGPSDHGGNVVLENVILERPTTGAASTGLFLLLNNQRAVALPSSLTNVDFVGADQATQVPASPDDNTKDSLVIYPSNHMTVNMTNVDFSAVNGMGNQVYVQHDFTTATFAVNIESSHLTNNRVPVTPVAGQVFLAAGVADVTITETSFTGGDANGNNFSSAVTISNAANVTLDDCDLRLNSGGARIVAFDVPGAELLATDCLVQAGSSACEVISGNPNGSYTFNNCSFDSGNTDSNTRMIQTYKASVQGEFVFNGPVFTGPVGGIPFEMTPGLKITVAGVPQNKVDLDPIIAGGGLMLGITADNNGGGDLTLRDVKMTEAPSFGLFQCWAGTTMTADLNLTIDRCEFLGGSGATGSGFVENYTGFGDGGSNITVTNSIFVNPGDETTGPAGWFNVYGTHTAPSTLTLTHNTFVGPMNSTDTTLFSAFDNGSAGRVDTLDASYNIFDDTGAVGVTYAYNAETGNISGTQNMWTDLDHVYNVPTDFMMGAVLAELKLTATGRLGGGDSVAADRAVTSNATVDVDGDVRPLGTYPDVGADEVMPATGVDASWTLY